MAAWQTASTSSTDDAGTVPGRHHLWPDFLVRWLFGRGDEERLPRAASGPVARFQNICISREAGAGGGTIARMVGKRLGWKVYDEELIEAIAHRMEVPLDEVRDARRAGAQRRPGLAPAPARGVLRPPGGLSRPPGQADRGDRPRRRIDPGRPRGRTSCCRARRRSSVRIIAPLKVRPIRLAERMGVSVRTARRAARDLDRRRLQFDRTMHRANSNDPAQLRHGARLAQPGPGDRRRGRSSAPSKLGRPRASPRPTP